MGHVFVIHGDLTQLQADAVVYSTSRALDGSGDLFSAFARNLPGFAEALRLLRAARIPLSVGQSFWIQNPGVDAPGVVGAVSVGGGLEKHDRCRRVVTSAVKVAAEGLRDRRRGRRVLVALPTFLAGQGGGRHEIIDLARTQLAAAREALRDLDNVDVAFVAYTAGIYNAFLSARRNLPPEPGATTPEPPEALVRAVRDGECVLFCGAGLSVGAGLGAWSDLVRVLRDRLGLVADPPGADVDYFLDLAQWYREAFPPGSPQALEGLIHEHFAEGAASKRPTLAHYLLFALQPRTVITTNYDDLLERTGRALRRPVTRVVEQKDVARTGRRGLSIVKLHGDAQVPGSVVLSRDDYDHFFAQRPAMALLLEGLLLNQTFFFIGYSLRDPDFRQIHSRISLMLAEARRQAFATTFEAHTPHALQQWRRKAVELVPLSGTGEERNFQLARWLDALCERVMHHPPVLLAPDGEAEIPDSLKGLREHLVKAGESLEKLCARASTDVEARELARVLHAMVGLGWRPKNHTPLWMLWHDLAVRLGDPTERRQILSDALAHTERLSDAEGLEELLVKLDKR